MSDFDGVSNVASAARFAMNPTPLGAAGLGLGIASSMLGGKGKKKKTFIPGYRDGQYINQVSGKPYDRANQMMITGDNGTYDLIPAIGSAQNNYMKQWQAAQQDISGSTAKPSADKMLYESMLSSLGDDLAAIAAFQKKYPLRSGGLEMPQGTSPSVSRWISGIDKRYDPNYKYMGMFGNNLPNLTNGLTNVQDTIGPDLAAFGNFANDKNIRRSSPRQLAQGLGTAPQYQAPNVQYQAPRG